jgi:hypothetical protein
MSSLIFHTEQEQAVIATDTLAVSPGGRPLTFTSKAFHVPHLRMVIAGTGCGGFLDGWLCHLNSRMIVPGIDALAVHAPAALQTLWNSYCAEYKISEGRTTTVYHFGFSEASDTIKSNAFRSENCFVSEERLLTGYLVLDLCNVIAGPACGRLLGELGATVIKLDSTRPDHQPLVTVVWGAEANQGKKSLLADLHSLEGREILERLVRRVDIVLMNETDT